MDMTQIIVNLTAARDSLSKENWKKGDYFAKQDSILCMCTHGAISLQCNEEVASLIASHQLGEAGNITELNTAMGAPYLSLYEHPYPLSEREIWERRERSSHESYLAWMVGLTLGFNDEPGTTLEMVKEKFDAAIALAFRLSSSP